ncbi:dTDP-4-amino-4,6-dideoxygalactose transaminase [Orbus mooreae]|uniref:dTDP-4-amino-4,6-dideoxygalactose transaminase n=1 Tax=Orbus mooreae TaxID=3074107 RepID=UPI00370D8BE3
MINFNEAPFLGTEFGFIEDAINSKHISGDGIYTKKCNNLLESYTNSPKSLLVHSGTAALEMAALLLKIKPGDEVICPSYTFVTTASAFALRGAKLVFIDIKEDTLNFDETYLEAAITNKTKAIVPVHYAGVACNMDAILDIAARYSIPVVEDAAQAVGSAYKGKKCGAIADLGCFSFHETKNISSGEGGALIINRSEHIEAAEIIREKGTNRSKFFRGQVDKYTWVELGSSYLPSDLIAAYLYPQLQQVDAINNKRMLIWNRYHCSFETFESKGIIKRPFIPNYCQHNAHMYYLRFNNIETRANFISYMKEHGITCVFHYIPLHSSPAGKKLGRSIGNMEHTNHISDTLVRLPLFHGMTEQMCEMVISYAAKFLAAQ